MLKKYGGWPSFERGIGIYKYILKEVKDTEDIYRKAAVLLRGLARGRIFKDGNHRTAQMVTEMFLEKNGVSMEVQDNNEVIRFIKDILQYDVDQIERWLEYGTV